MTELRVERELAASADRVWAAFTTAEAIALWMWPGSFATTATVDLRVGGRYRIESLPMSMAVEGEFVALEPISRVVQTWRWDGEDDETLVTVTIEPTAARGSRLTVLHERFAGDEDAASHLQGWNDCLDRLPDYLAGA